MAHITREEGHLIVAAIRILSHREGTLPGYDETAEMLRMQPETLRMKVSELETAGVLMRVESAWDVHLEIRDHLLLEELEPEAQTAAMEDELAAFDLRKQEEAERMSRLFSDGDHEKRLREKIDEMDDGLFRHQRGKPANPFDKD